MVEHTQTIRRLLTFSGVGAYSVGEISILTWGLLQAKLSYQIISKSHIKLHIKPKFILWTKLFENLLIAKYPCDFDAKVSEASEKDYDDDEDEFFCGMVDGRRLTLIPAWITVRQSLSSDLDEW